MAGEPDVPVPSEAPASRESQRGSWSAALVPAAIWLVVAVILAPDYGPTWDGPIGELPLGEQLLAYVTSGDGAYVDFEGELRAPELKEPHPDFEMRFNWWQVYPVAGLLSAVSCRLLWSGLGWMPALEAHHFVVALFVALLFVVQVRFVGKRAGVGAALLGALLVIVSPRYFAHAFNNVKDVPETCLYVLASFAGFRALLERRLSLWALAGCLTGLAVAQKANGFFLPIELGLFTLLGTWVARRDGGVVPRITTRGVGVGALAFVASWVAVWIHAWGNPFEGAWLFVRETFLVGNAYSAGAAHELGDALTGRPAVSLHGPMHVLWTTPLPILVLAPFGLFARSADLRLRLLLFCGVVVPIGRLLLPGMRDFDGVRHFLEFLPPLAALAGIGAFQLARFVVRVPRRAWMRPALAALALVPGGLATARLHPNGICYYNALVGGLAGAQERGVSGATDYWCNSYWQGLAWISENAEQGAALFVPIASHVAQTAAPVRLRSDIALDPSEAEVIYVMYVTRDSWYGPFLRALDDEREPVHEIRVEGAPVLRIQRIADPEERARRFADWLREQQATVATKAVWAHMLGDADCARALGDAFSRRAELGPEETLSRFRAALPPELQLHAADALWLLDSRSSTHP